MSRRHFTACLLVGYIAIVPFAARGQDSGTADTLYNKGVQAYFSGRSADAESSFSNLMRLDPKDPRPYYFRALSRIGQGREAEARSDMEFGAQLEARSAYRFDIGKTLERVQGPARLVLEQYRSRARTAAGMNPPLGPLRAPDTAVLRARRIVPLDEFSRSGEPQSFAAPIPPPETIIPPAAAPQTPAGDRNPVPARAGNPFGDDAATTITTKSPANAAQPKTPPAKAATPEPPLPPAPKPAAPAPEASDTDQGNPFL